MLVSMTDWIDFWVTQEPLGLHLRDSPQKWHRGEKTYSEDEWHQAMGWGPALNEKGERRKELSTRINLLSDCRYHVANYIILL